MRRFPRSADRRGGRPQRLGGRPGGRRIAAGGRAGRRSARARRREAGRPTLRLADRRRRPGRYDVPDLGRTWQPPPGRLPDGAARFDFAALAVRGPQGWIVGSPGSRVFHSADAGQTWETFPTGTTLPLRAIAMADDQNGWAVGDLGLILATRDGGRSWRRQRSGGNRAGLLAVFAEPEALPWECLARLCADEGFLGVGEIVGRRDVETAPRAAAPVADRTHEAMLAVGGCGAETAWRFPLRQPGLRSSAEQIVAGWDRANSGTGMEELHAYLVRQIRLWRPDTIVTHDATERAGDAVGPLVHRAVLEACRRAADPSSYPKLPQETGLEPWRVRRVYAVVPAGSRGDGELSTNQVAFRLGRTLADAAEPARSLLDEGPREPPAAIGFRLLSVDAQAAAQAKQDRLLLVSTDAEVRRWPGDAPSENVESLQHLAHAAATARRFSNGWSRTRKRP